MSTRATIRFKDGDEEYFVYRHSDGYPENVLPDIHSVIKKKKNSWAGPELGLLVSCFLGEHYNEKFRLPEYMMTTSFHGDESYKYFVEWNEKNKEWVISCR